MKKLLPASFLPSFLPPSLPSLPPYVVGPGVRVRNGVRPIGVDAAGPVLHQEGQNGRAALMVCLGEERDEGRRSKWMDEGRKGGREGGTAYLGRR